MKKQGFTLIELMVVVVIIGILAAVAVPKLFGMIAKSKASEVGPAAGEYVKLQDAYYAETASAGTWAKIGYAMSDSKNFKYAGGTVEPTNTCISGTWDKDQNKCMDGSTPSTVSGSTITDGWTAENPIKLNDCNSGINWKISATTKNDVNATGGASLTYTSAKLDAGCEALTPQFTNIAPVSAN